MPIHSPVSPHDLLGITDAAALLQPHLGELNAGNWLTDLRRTNPVYHKRVYTPPTFEKHNGVIKYRRSEIERLIHELSVFTRRRRTVSPRPVTRVVKLP